MRHCSRPKVNNAPAITKAKVGSHWPVTSKKANTLDGLVIPARIKPKPNTKPLAKALRINLKEVFLKDMAHHIYSDARTDHKGKCGDNRSF